MNEINYLQASRTIVVFPSACKYGLRKINIYYSFFLFFYTRKVAYCIVRILSDAYHTKIVRKSRKYMIILEYFPYSAKYEKIRENKRSYKALFLKRFFQYDQNTSQIRQNTSVRLNTAPMAIYVKISSIKQCQQKYRLNMAKIATHSLATRFKIKTNAFAGDRHLNRSHGFTWRFTKYNYFASF